jgi:fatty-acid peroxygenase
VVIDDVGLADSTLSFLRDPYRFMARRTRSTGSDVAEARLLLRPATFLTGRDGAELVYDTSRFQRAGAAPGRLTKSLFGRGGVQGLDGAEHLHRKAGFVDVITDDTVADLAAEFTSRWRRTAQEWVGAERVDLYPAMQQVLTRAVCAWAGVPLAEREVAPRTRQLSALFDGAGAVGPRHWKARLARRQADRGAETVIEAVRAGRLPLDDSAPAARIARWTNAGGGYLPSRTAAVELLNVLRPTVAVSVYIVFVAHALDRFPEWRTRLAQGDGSEDEMVVQEVRRCAPFFPAVAAVARDDVQWHGHHIPQGRRVVLDLYGTNHDPRSWDEPQRFDPERFRAHGDDPYGFVPQGGGDRLLNHRCPGEPVAVRLMMVAVDMLTRRMTYDVVESNADIDYRRLPALPTGGVTLTNVSLNR